jgi:aldehyde dehydrogenase (NAD+)
VTLELGGKSPVIIDETANLKTAAETLMWGKLANCGQTCVAPDHVYVHESVKDQFVAECKAVITERYGATSQAQQASPHFARVINQRHTARIGGLLDDARGRGARFLIGGDYDVAQSFVSPTLLDNIPADASIMSEEIFGPVFPVIAWRDLDKVIADINAGPKPLALYIWSHNKARTRRIMQETSSGGVGINHCVLHFAHGNLPFGGVNNSGIGAAHGVHGFKAFSHERAVLKSGPIMVAKLFFPPYTGFKPKLIRMVVDSLKLPKLF